LDQPPIAPGRDFDRRDAHARLNYAQNPLRQKPEFPEPAQSDLGCPDLGAKIFCFA
jgi:hypothetical protein